MRSTSIFGVVALAVMALADDEPTPFFSVFSDPTLDEVIPAGKPFVVNWAAGDFSGQATLSLVGGEAVGTQIPLANLTTLDVTENTFTWNVDCSLGAATLYGLKMTLVDKPTIYQWSSHFSIDNSGCVSNTVTSTSSSTSAPTIPAEPESESNTSTKTESTSYTTSNAVGSSSLPIETTSVSPTVSTSETITSVTSPAGSGQASTTPSSTTSSTPNAAATKLAGGSFGLAGFAAAAVFAF